jgi:hypothetical protein
MPLPNTKVIPRNWSKHHVKTVLGTMNARCTITRKGEGASTFDPETGNMVPPVRETIYGPEGKCRVQQLQRDAQVAVVGDQGIVTASVLVVIPWDVAPLVVGEEGDKVHIDWCDNDIPLESSDLFIMTQNFASERWERDLYCQFDMSRNRKE